LPPDFSVIMPLGLVFNYIPAVTTSKKDPE